MRAIRIETLDGPDAIVLRDVSEPEPVGDQLVIDAHAHPWCLPTCC